MVRHERVTRLNSHWAGVARIDLTRFGPAAPPVVWGLVGPQATDVGGEVVNGSVPQDVPWLDSQWAATGVGPDSIARACAASTLTAGLFWSIDGDQLLVAPRLAELIAARRAPTTFSDDWLRGHLLLSATADQTPYREVHRLPPATMASWRQGDVRPELRQWSGPQVWREATLSGDAAMNRYVQAFDASVDQMVASDEPICATLSGGLDSTFVVASLARLATEDRPVHAFSHRPHPDAQLRSVGHWDPDDFVFAERLAAHYPGKIILHPLVNEALTQPLDSAAASAEDRWVPVVNPSNQIWIDEAGRQADALGAGVVFMGENGNSAFSYDHPYAAGYYLRRRDPQSMVDLVRAERMKGLSVLAAHKKSWIGPLTAPVRSRLRRRGQATTWYRRQPEPLFAGSGRTAYLNWLRADRSFRAQGQPDASGVLMADPFTAARVLEVAARIEPAEWRRGPLNRSFARRAGVGRVPDEVRLRTRRGGQSWDAWFVIRHQRERYLDETMALFRTPVMCDVVDVEGMMADIQQWPWGQVQGPQLGQVIAAERLLHVGQFTRMTLGRLNTH